MQQFEYLNEILIRFNEHNGNYQGAHVRNIKGVRDENGKILFAQMTDPVGLNTLPDLNDLFGDLAQSLLVEIEEKGSNFFLFIYVFGKCNFCFCNVSFTK